MTSKRDDETASSPHDSEAYRLASRDIDFLATDDLRPIRLQLELLKPELYLRQEDIRSTIPVFGSARILPPDAAAAHLDALEHGTDSSTASPSKLARARKQVEYAKYYAEAQAFSGLVSQRLQNGDGQNYVIVTGGGPGIMEAANRGAHEAGSRSIGLNITLPSEQTPNPYTSPELCFQFRYFAIRKMHFLLRAKALVAFPGGYGTMDELFEVLTLIQTRKILQIPVVLIGKAFWQRAIDFSFLVEEGMLNADHITLFEIVETANEAVNIIDSFYQEQSA
ncbi:LOG family protein [Pyruvatibacter sp. HU-CL02332]|uniref:LOG family protein n=1 Tax=Pyruvatibacter sp. HU-CL02332 TaxID=3127650 RepID=UPI00310AEE3F